MKQILTWLVVLLSFRLSSALKDQKMAEENLEETSQALIGELPAPVEGPAVALVEDDGHTTENSSNR